MDFKEIIANKISDVINIDANELKSYIEVPKDNANGDYSFPCFRLAKELRKSPVDIANLIKDGLNIDEIFEKVDVVSGFLNFYINKAIIVKSFFDKFNANENYGSTNMGKGKTVIVEYSSPNIAKRMHIGHLRSTIIGDSIKRTLQFLGFHTLADNHIGDWGTQFGKLIVAYKNWLNKKAYEEDPIGELERIYVQFSDEAKKNPALEDEAREELKKLQLGDEENQKLWKEFIDISLKEYNKIYDRLGVNFDYYYGESFYNDMMPAVLEELKEKGIAREDQGALVVFFENDKLPPAIVQKKDGSFLYTTSDLATMKFRKDELNVDEAVYLTDDRQQNHFKQVFEIGEMLGEPYNYKKTHVVFGIMRFGDGMIFSSRSGNIIRLVDLLDEAKTQVKKVIDEKNPDIPEEEKEKIAEIVGSGAIKYFDLSQNRTSDITFTWDKVLSFEGNTGPYLQYTYVRIMSIFRKLKEENINVENKDIILENMNGVERELAVELLRFPQTVVKSYESYRPNIIADYLFDIAKLFNNFYNSNSILKEENKKVMDARILLAEKTAFILKEGLGLLGINTVDRM